MIFGTAAKELESKPGKDVLLFSFSHSYFTAAHWAYKKLIELKKRGEFVLITAGKVGITDIKGKRDVKLHPPFGVRTSLNKSRPFGIKLRYKYKPILSTYKTLS